MLVDISKIKRYTIPKASSTLRNMKKESLIEYIRTLEHNYDVAMSFLDNQAKHIESLDISPKWIPVSERLPEDWKERVLVLLTKDLVYGHPVVDTDRCMDGIWMRYSDCHITHWMPIPEPPKEYR